MTQSIAPFEPIGGRPVRDGFLPFSPPSLGPEEEAEVIDTLRSGWITTGPKTERFEGEVAKYCGVEHAVAVSSCTAALHLAVVLAKIGPGDEVITTPFTFASTAHVIMYQGATPVFVDICQDTFNIDPKLVEEKITPRTKAIMAMDYGGHPCDMDALSYIANKHGLKLLVDAAHSIGSTYKGRQVGTMGDIICFSFYATKNLATGEGGMLLTHDESIAKDAKILAMYGISDARQIWARYSPKGSWYYDIPELGFKYNFTDIQASLGIHQLAKLNGFIERRRENAEVYQRVLTDCPYVKLPQERPEARSNYHLFPLLLNLDRLTIGRDEFVERLKAENIGASVLWSPLPNHTLYRRNLGANLEDFPVTQDTYLRILNLPVSPAASTDDIQDAANAVLKICEHFAQ